MVYHRGLMKSAAGDESGGQRSDPRPGEHAAAGKGDLPEVEWNFDNVPDGELVACCYWEYARESAFIREMLRQYRDWCLAGGKRDDESRKIDARLRKLQSIGPHSDVFLQGCICGPETVWQSDDPEKPNYRPRDTPPITGSFPAPWRSLSEVERKCRANIRDEVEHLHILPVKLAHWTWANEIGRVCLEIADRQREQEKSWERDHLRKDKEGNRVTLPGAPAPPEFEPIQPAIRSGAGETVVVDIAWAHFTNDQIATYFRRWAKANRPKNITSPGGQGHKLKDWRVALDRLGMMRLLHRFRLGEMRERFPAGWKAFAGFEWYKERKRAGATFKKLFPFLPKTERPLSWPTKGGRSK